MFGCPERTHKCLPTSQVMAIHAVPSGLDEGFAWISAARQSLSMILVSFLVRLFSCGIGYVIKNL